MMRKCEKFIELEAIHLDTLQCLLENASAGTHHKFSTPYALPTGFNQSGYSNNSDWLILSTIPKMLPRGQKGSVSQGTSCENQLSVSILEKWLLLNYWIDGKFYIGYNTS